MDVVNDDELNRLLDAPITVVFNLDTGDYGPVFSLPPREAVIAAHAQSLGDWNTWDYERCWGHMAVVGDTVVTCGSFTAMLEQ